MKIVNFLAGTVVFTTVAMASTVAWSASLSFGPPATTLSVGDSVNIDIVLGGMNDFDTISVFDFNVNYDASILSFNSYSMSNSLGDTLFSEAMDLSFGNGFQNDGTYVGDGTLHLAELSLLWADLFSGESFFADQFTPASDSLTLATLSFSASGPGVSGLTFSNVLLGDEWGSSFNASLNSASIEVGDPVPEPATMLLFGTGLAGLAGARLRRNKK